MERGGYATIAADKAFLLLFAASAFVAFIFAQQQSTLPLYVERILHLRAADFGLLVSLNGVLVLAIELPVSSVTMRHPPKQMMGLGFLLFGAGFALTATAHTLLALLGTVAIWTLGEIVSAPVAYAYLADLAPEHLRGRYQGIYELAWGFGGVAGPALGAVLLAWSVNGLWAVCGALGLAASVLVLASPQRGPAGSGPTIVLPEAEPAAITPPL
jgi:dipeptide/tripeptide permease